MKISSQTLFLGVSKAGLALAIFLFLKFFTTFKVTQINARIIPMRSLTIPDLKENFSPPGEAVQLVALTSPT